MGRTASDLAMQAWAGERRRQRLRGCRWAQQSARVARRCRGSGGASAALTCRVSADRATTTGASSGGSASCRRRDASMPSISAWGAAGGRLGAVSCRAHKPLQPNAAGQALLLSPQTPCRSNTHGALKNIKKTATRAWHVDVHQHEVGAARQCSLQRQCPVANNLHGCAGHNTLRGGKEGPRGHE